MDASLSRRFVVVSLLFVATGVAAARDDPATAVVCPSPLTMWAVSEQATPSGPWTFRFLELRDGFARHRGLETWFATPKISDEDRRWFVRGEADPVPTYLAVTSQQSAFSEMELLCDALGGVDAIQHKAGELCERGPGGDVRAMTTDAGMLYGILARPAQDDERCKNKKPPPQGGTGRRAERAVFRSLVLELKDSPGAAADDPLRAASRTVVDTWKSFLTELPADKTGPEGLAKLPAAQSMIDLLLELDNGRVPQSLRSDLLLAVAAGAPSSYTVALAVETLERPASRQALRSALLFLGDRQAIGARDALVLLLRRSTDDEEVAALSLRALVRADPATAKMEALNMLSDPSDIPVAALGVFAVTQVGFDSELEGLDLDDHDAVCEAAVSVVNRVASTGNDDELRTAASTILQRQAAGDDPGN